LKLRSSIELGDLVNAGLISLIARSFIGAVDFALPRYTAPNRVAAPHDRVHGQP